MTEIDRLLADATVLDRGGYPYLIHPLTDGVPRCDPALLRAWCQWAQEQPCLADADVLLAPEAMALPLATALSLATDIPMLVVRKRQYGLPGETVAYCETGYGESCLYINDVLPGDRVVIVDDVLSTGGTMDGLLSSLKTMEVHVAGLLVFLDKGDQAQALAEHHDVPVAVMRTVRIEDGRVVPVEQ